MKYLVILIIITTFLSECDSEYSSGGSKTFNEHFGVIKGDGFWVTIEFTEFAAVYVAERVWNSRKRVD